MMPRFVFLVLIALVAPINAAKVEETNGLKARALALREAAIRKRMKSMSMEDAFKVLDHKHGVPKSFSTLVKKELSAHGHSVGEQHLVGKSRFRGSHLGREDPSGYGGGVGAADEMLGQMIGQAEMNLDTEEERCELFNSQSNGAMEMTRQDIASANAQSAEGRAEIMRANAEIEVLQQKIPQTKDELEDHNEECASDIAALNSQIGIVSSDLSVMDTVVNMSVCNDAAVDSAAAAFLETSKDTAELMCCKKPGSDHVAIYMKPSGPLSKLKSATGHYLVNSSFSKAHRAHRHVSLAQLDSQAGYFVMSEPDTPVVSGEVCPEENAAKCTIADSPACPRIRNKFLDLQSGIRGKLEDLQQELANTETECETTKLNLEAQIRGLGNTLVQEQAASAQATEQMNQADEQSRLKQQALIEQRRAHRNELKTCTIYEGGIECEAKDDAGVCSENINAYMSEICGLKKIRTELSEVEGDNMTMISDITDCEVSEWTPNPCSVTCGGGELTKTRHVTVQPSHGASCPPLEIQEPCSIDPCPIDCVHSQWGEWSSCSASCGGGAKERKRGIDVHAFFGGEQCGDTTEAEDCNVESCDQDCELNEWTEWCGCDVMCGGGEQKRVRTVKKPASGQGTCPLATAEAREEFQSCNTQSCASLLGLNDRHPYLECENKIDIILVIEGSEDLEEEGWNAMKSFTERFVRSMDMTDGHVEMAILLYSGPTRQPYFNYCRGDDLPSHEVEWDPASACSVNWIEHFTGNDTKLLESVENMEWPKGGRMTHMALEFAEAELANGRPDTESVVFVLTSGAPNAARLTKEAASSLREKTRLMFGLVGADVAAMAGEYQSMVDIPRPRHIVYAPHVMAMDGANFVNKAVSEICTSLDFQHCPYERADTRCPIVADSACSNSENVLFIGAGGRKFTENIADREQALRDCGGVCDSDPECGGFEFDASQMRCLYRKITLTEGPCATAEPSPSDSKSCFSRVDYSCVGSATGELLAGSVA